MQIPVDRVPPNNPEAEKSALGACLISKDALSIVAETITDSADFYKTAHQIIFEAILKLFERSEAVDLITLTNELNNTGKLEDAGGIDYLTHLMDLVPTASNAEYYSNIVKEKAVLRNLIVAGMNIISLGHKIDEPLDKVVDDAEKEIFTLSQKRTKNDFVPINTIMTSTYARLEELYGRKAHITGIPSGFSDLDHHTAGFQKGNLIIVAARPGMGKTAFCLNIAQHIAIKEKQGAAIFSLEMPKEELAQRFLCSEAKIDGQRLKTGHLQEADWPRLANAMNDLSKAPIYIDDTSNVSVMEMRSKARRLKSKNDISLIIVDYLQLMRGNAIFKGDRNQEISEISRQLKALSKELEIPIIALSQLSRAVETRQEKKPMLSDLRDSGGIEQDADMVLFIYRDQYYNRSSSQDNRAEINIAKHRNGPLATVNLVFLNQYATFAQEDRRQFE